MPTSAPSRVPSYRRHKPTNQAVVTINGQDIYLGKWNTAASKAEYDRLIAEFLANGRRLRNEIESTVVEVINAYRKFAERYYRKNGLVTREYGCIKEALKIVRVLYGRTNANEFGSLALKAVRQRMIDNGWSRGYINKSIGRVRRCFKWAVENELVRPDMYHGLMAVSGLRKGRSEARESAPVLPRWTMPPFTDHNADSAIGRGRYSAIPEYYGVSTTGCLQSAPMRRGHVRG